MKTTTISIDSKFAFAKFAPKYPDHHRLDVVELRNVDGRLKATITDKAMLLQLDLGEAPEGLPSKGILIPAKDWKEVFEVGKVQDERKLILESSKRVSLIRGENSRKVSLLSGQFPSWEMLIDLEADHIACRLAFAPSRFSKACQFLSSTEDAPVEFKASGPNASIMLTRKGSKHLAVVMPSTLG